MTTDPIAGIYHRHMNALSAVSVTDDDVRLQLIGFSLRLAMAEYAAELAARMAQPSAACVDQQIAEHNAAQIERLNEWMAEYAPAEYVSPDDTATCVLRLLKELRGLSAKTSWYYQELEMVTAERDAADLRCAELEAEIDGLRVQLVPPARRGNGAGLVDSFDSVVVNPPVVEAEDKADLTVVYDGLSSWHEKVRMWFATDAQMLEWYDGIRMGRHTFRQLPKPVRWQLVCMVVNSLRNAETGEWPTSSEFDKLRPEWMPTAGAAVVTFGNGKWQSIIDKVMAS